MFFIFFSFVLLERWETVRGMLALPNCARIPEARVDGSKIKC